MRLLDAIGDERLQRSIRSEVAEDHLGAFFKHLRILERIRPSNLLSSRALQGADHPRSGDRGYGQKSPAIRS